MIQGLRTAIYPVTQLNEATDWYRRVLDKRPISSNPSMSVSRSAVSSWA